MNYEKSEPTITEGEWFEQLYALQRSKGLSANPVRERWITHYNSGATPEEAMRNVLGDAAFDRLCSHGVHCQGLCQCQDDHNH